MVEGEEAHHHLFISSDEAILRVASLPAFHGQGQKAGPPINELVAKRLGGTAYRHPAFPTAVSLWPTQPHIFSFLHTCFELRSQQKDLTCYRQVASAGREGRRNVSLSTRRLSVFLSMKRQPALSSSDLLAA